MIGNFIRSLGTVIVFFITLTIGLALAARLFNINLEPYILKTGELITGGKLVNFETAFETDQNPGAGDFRVCEVHRVDTDGDGFNEWLVYYQYDTTAAKTWRNPCPGRSPMAARIYDNDRGQPTVLLPYNLEPPNRKFLGEQGITLQQHEIVANPGSPSTAPIKELLFYGAGGGTNNQLTVWKYQHNTNTYEDPTNIPPRYQLIGDFYGSGGVTFDENTKIVTVKERIDDRSQLVVKNTYALHGERDQETYNLQVGSTQLHPPVASTVDFGARAPDDIFNTQYPEKILLAFYQTLDPAYNRSWNSTDFLAAGSTAATEFANKNLAYFGFADEGKVTNLAVTQIDTYVGVEQASAGASIDGAQANGSVVGINVNASQGGQQAKASGMINYLMVYQSGQWKIQQRIQ